MKKNQLSKTVSGILFPVLLLLIAQHAVAQQPVAPTLPDTSKMTYNQISKQAQLYVYPTKGQSNQQQKEDEFECYKWAVSQSGIDPLNLPKVEAAPVQTGPDGSAIVGAAKGAAAGAAIGAIAGDAGKGAAIGAVAGGLGGNRQRKQSQAQSSQQAQQQADAQNKANIESFRKAFTVCIEGKGYSVK